MTTIPTDNKSSSFVLTPYGDTVRLHCIEAGTADGPTMVLLHGALDDCTSYEGLISALGGRFRLLIPDLRGHGRSARASSYRVIDYAGDIVALIERAPSRPVVIVGHSLGGLIALQLAAARPDLVAALVLIDPPLLVTEEPGWPQHFMYDFFPAIAALLNDGAGEVATITELVSALAVPRPDATKPLFDRLVSVGKIAAALREAGVRSDPDVAPAMALTALAAGRRPRFDEMLTPAALQGFSRQLAQVDPRVATTIANGTLNTGFDHCLALTAIQCPLLYLESDRDLSGLLDRTDVAAVLKAAANVDPTHRLIDGAGHYIHQDRPEVFLDDLRCFLDRSS